MSTQDRFSMPLGEALYTLRAIRRIKPDPVPDDDLAAILEAATQAPSGGNLQPWHFLVVRDAEKRQQFAPLYHEAWWAKRNDSGFTGPDDLPDSFRPAMGLAEEIGEVPVLLFVCAVAKGFGAAGSVIPAVQNLLLAARGLDIGGTITTLHPTVEDRVHELFGIPESAQIVYCIPLGYPRGRFGPVSRKPVAEVTSYEHWGRPSG